MIKNQTTQQKHWFHSAFLLNKKKRRNDKIDDNLDHWLEYIDDKQRENGKWTRALDVWRSGAINFKMCPTMSGKKFEFELACINGLVMKCQKRLKRKIEK